MWMGFLGIRDGAPPPASDEPPGGSDEGESDDTGIRPGPSLESVRQKYRRERSWLGRYAWVISIGAHVVVLVVAYLAFRHYFQQTPRPEQISEQHGPGSFVAGGDATDRVHGFFLPGLSLNDSVLSRAAMADQEFPSIEIRDPQITETLRVDPQISAQAIEPTGGVISAQAPSVRWWTDSSRPAATQPGNTSNAGGVN